MRRPTHRPKLRRQATTLRLRRGEDALRLVVVADTHSAPHPRSEELIAGLEPDHILHAGDIGDLGVLEKLAAIAPTSAVRGNIDVHAVEVPDTLTIDVNGSSDEAGDPLLRILLLHIGVNGPRIRADAAKLAREEEATLVVCGHSHVPFIGRDRGLAVHNPGSIGPRRFHLPIVFGVIDISPRGVAMRHIDCETGRPWAP